MSSDFFIYDYILCNIFKYFKLHNYARFSLTCVLFREISKNKNFKRCINYILYFDINVFECLPNKTYTRITEQFPNITITKMEVPYSDQIYSRNLCNRYNCYKFVDKFNTNHLCHICEKYYKLCPVNNCFRIIKNKKNMCIYHYREKQPNGINFKSYHIDKYFFNIQKCCIQYDLYSYEDTIQYCKNDYIKTMDYSTWFWRSY